MLSVLALDLNSAASILDAAQQTAVSLMKNYPGSNDGSIPQNGLEDSTGVQWYESGILWMTVLEYSRNSGDSQFVQTVSGALANASYGASADFLGPGSIQQLTATLLGKWNDDIAWWAMAPMTSLELFGTEILMPNKVPFKNLVINTYTDIWQQWDTSSCGGGIYWSRNRNATNLKQRYYKSTITNGQYVLLSARLYKLFKMQYYLDRAKQVYQWIKSSGLITSTWDIYDGLTTPTCNITQDHYVYQPGILSAGLAYLTNATNDESYIQDAYKLFYQAQKLYTVNNVWTDFCEVSKPYCADNTATPKGAGLLGFTMLYQMSSDQQFRSAFKQTVLASVEKMLPQCDTQYNCANTWYTGKGPANFHTQLNALALMNALIVVSDASKPTQLQPPQPVASIQPQKSSAVTHYSLVCVFLTLFWV
ncbi:glycoside hydrolase [Gorgonomyces haynaldii]|nr:glycoside hydrolase [Gorgonomyces haynaldii]